jgi:Heparinase II/III-like protein/Heparinase II/III N-terminus
MVDTIRLNRLLGALRRESPTDLAKEALWRTTKHWRRAHLERQLSEHECPVFFALAGYYRPRLDKLSLKSRDFIIRYAECISAGQFPWFAYGPVKLGLPPRWDYDFVSNTTWAETPSNPLQVVRHDGSDVKVPWELSRLQFLPILAKADRIERGNGYRATARDILSDWMRRNPTMVGVNWTVAMEAALRAVSICLTLELLHPFTPEDDSWLGAVTKCLWQHLLFIEAHIEFSHLTRGNHYLSNIVGLLCLSTYLRGPGMEDRRRRYAKQVEEEILVQVFEDGGNREASTGYHVLVLQMFATARRLMKCRGTNPSEVFTGRLRRMFRLLSALTDEQGNVPLIGDCDDGRIELLTDDLEAQLGAPERPYSLKVSSLLGTGQLLCKECLGGLDYEAAWYGDQAVFSQPSKAAHRLSRSLVFGNSGIAVSQKGAARVLFLAMPNANGGKGSHTHNDKLSFVLKVHGEEIFVDAGTGTYTRHAGLRNELRSTRAHNTIQIDAEEQNRFPTTPELGPLFTMVDDAHVTPIQIHGTDEPAVVRASHDGYRRVGISHTRAVTLLEGSLLIKDDLTGSGRHDFQAFFHLSPIWRVLIEKENGIEVSCQLQGPFASRLVARAPVPICLATCGGKLSTAYGNVSEATTVVVRGTLNGSVSLSTEVSWEQHN